MCRSALHGGRRCNHADTKSGRALRNLQAKKQYHEHKLSASDLSPEDRIKSEKAFNSAVESMNQWREEKHKFGVGKHFVMDINPETEIVLNQLEADGFDAYIVGGSVRDVLMGMPSKDIDIEVYGGTANQISASLNKIGRVDEVGKAFGVLKIRLGQEDFDISLPRKDSKVGDGHRGFDISVDPHLSLEEATERRDYTINALMYSHKHGFIIDKHNGLEDLQNKQLRHVSDAFDEDPLRVLRGVQMASRFGMDLHPDTIAKAQTLKNSFNELAVERVQTEFQKLYEKGKSSHKALKLLKATGWDENFAGLKEANTKELRSNVKRMQGLISDEVVPKERRDVFLSASIAAGIKNERDRQKFLSTTCVGDRVKNEALHLTKMEAPSEINAENLKNWAYGLPRDLSIRDWSILQTSNGNAEYAKKVLKTAKKNGVADKPEPDILSGEDVLALFPNERPGRWVGANIAAARAAQYAGKFKSHAEALSWLNKNKIFA
jgi:tRNA nucleotidyltransferase/poly(A) polymerase